MKITKKCSGCGQVKSVDEFGSDTSRIDGKNGKCKACIIERNKARKPITAIVPVAAASSIANFVNFEFEGRTIRTAKAPDGTDLLIAKDICDILELENVSRAVDRLDGDEVFDVTSSKVDGSLQKFKAITEPGFWKLVLTSRSEKVKPFIRFITHVVIPSIRATGFYVQEGREENARDEMNRILLDQAMKKYEALWSVELPTVLSKVCPHWKTSNKIPASLTLEIYHRTIGRRLIDIARDRRNAQHTKTLHQFFTVEARQQMRDKIEAVIAIARISRDYSDFLSKLYAGIGGGMLQLDLVVEVGKCPTCFTVTVEGSAFCHACGKRLQA